MISNTQGSELYKILISQRQALWYLMTTIVAYNLMDAVTYAVREPTDLAINSDHIIETIEDGLLRTLD
jgi:hypothetical protein